MRAEITHVRKTAAIAIIVFLLQVAFVVTTFGQTSASASTPSDASPTTQNSCTDAADLLAAGQNADAKTAFETLLKADPELSCAIKGLQQSEGQSQIRLCMEGNALESAGQLDAAKADFEAAIGAATAGSPPTCAVQGLSHVTSEQNAIAPSWWSTGQHAITRWGLGVLWMLLALAVGTTLLAGTFGWSVRGYRRLRPESPLRLVPRVRLVPLSGPGGNGTADNLTALLRSQMQSVQTSDEVKLDFVATDTRVQGLVTAVKDIDSTAGGWIELFTWLSWLWPWQTLSVQGQALPAGNRGEGITLSIGAGAHQPSSATFWSRPDEAPAPRSITSADGTQNYYNLIPAAATWAIYECARLGDTSVEALTDIGAVSHGYLAIGYAVAAQKHGADPEPFYEAARKEDPANQAAQLAMISTFDSNDSANRLLGILESWTSGPPTFDVAPWRMGPLA
jgi:hypothetical protein